MAEEAQRRPDPDPTVLTTAALLREIANLKDQFETKLNGEVKSLQSQIEAIEKATGVFQEHLTRVPTETEKAVGNLQHLQDTRLEGMAAEVVLVREVIRTRFEGMDRALMLLQTIADRFPERIDEKIGSLKEVHDGQFTAIQVQFTERDTRTEQISKQSEVAINAALQAAKEAVAEQNRSSALAIAKSEAATDKRIDQIGALVSTATSALDGKIVDIKDRLVRIEGQGLGMASTKGDQHTSSSFLVAVIAVIVAAVSAAISLFSHLAR